MKIISSYGVELRKQNIPIRQTLEIYRSAVPGCHPISDGRQSSMRLGVYLLIGRVWNSGKQRDRKQESRI